MPLASAPHRSRYAPEITAIHCRVISVGQYGSALMAASGRQTTCEHTVRAASTADMITNLYEHLKGHGIDEEDADHHACKWIDAAQQRIGARHVLTEVLTEQGVETTEAQMKAIIRTLARKGAPITISPGNLYRDQPWPTS